LLHASCEKDSGRLGDEIDPEEVARKEGAWQRANIEIFRVSVILITWERQFGLMAITTRLVPQ
jgi:hypothetical protein